MCPKCLLLPRQYMQMEQDPLLSEGGVQSFTPQSLFELIFSPLHVDLRCGEGWIRLACLAAVGLSQCGKTHPLYWMFERKMGEIIAAYLNRERPIILNKIRPGNKGTSNTGALN